MRRPEKHEAASGRRTEAEIVADLHASQDLLAQQQGAILGGDDTLHGAHHTQHYTHASLEEEFRQVNGYPPDTILSY